MYQQLVDMNEKYFRRVPPICSSAEGVLLLLPSDMGLVCNGQMLLRCQNAR